MRLSMVVEIVFVQKRLLETLPNVPFPGRSVPAPDFLP
jgi:hypothetical protein